MTRSRWRRRLAWVLGIPFGMALLGWVALLAITARLDAAIAAEQDALAQLGIWSLAKVSSKPSHDGYERLANRIREIETVLGEAKPLPDFLIVSDKSTDGVQSELLELLVQASKQPVILVQSEPRMDIFTQRFVIGDWVRRYAQKRAQAQDWRSLDELKSALISESVLTVRRDLVEWPLLNPVESPSSEFPLEQLAPMKRSARPVRDWLKRALLAVGPRQFDARDATVTLTALRLAARNSGRHPNLSWWERLIVGNPICLKLFDLEASRATRRIYQGLQSESLSRPLGGLPDALTSAIDRHKSKIVRTFPAPQFQFLIFPTAEHERRTLLIELDLREAIDEKRTLAPTWSKPLCVDPVSRLPVNVSVNGKRVSINSPDPRCEWESTFTLD